VTITCFYTHPRLTHLPNEFDSRPNHFPIIQTWGYLKWHLSPHFWKCNETIRSAIILDLEAVVQRFSVNTLDDNIADVSFDVLHCALTALVVSFPFVRLPLVDNILQHMMYNTKQIWYEGRKHKWNDSMDHTLEHHIDEYPEDPEKRLDENVASVFYNFRKVLDACYAKIFSLSLA